MTFNLSFMSEKNGRSDENLPDEPPPTDGANVHENCSCPSPRDVNIAVSAIPTHHLRAEWAWAWCRLVGCSKISLPKREEKTYTLGRISTFNFHY